MPERMELWSKTSQRGLLSISHQRLEKDSDWTLAPERRRAMSLPAWPRHGPCKPSSCARFTLNRHWGKPATGRSLASMRAQSLWSCPTLHLCGLWPARLLCQGGEFSRQEYWSVLANAGCHTLLEHCISRCPNRQPSRVPGAARTPTTQPAAPLHTWPSQGQTQVLQDSLRSKPQWTDPHAEVEIKPQLKPRGSVAEEEDPEPAHQLHKLQIKFTGPTRQTLCLWSR